MKKKFFMMIAVVVYCVVFAAQMSWAAQYTIKFAHTLPPKKDSQYHIWALKFAEYLDKYTKGAVEVKILPGGQMGSQIVAAKKLQMNFIQMQTAAANNLAALYPGFDLFTLPFLFKDLECGVLRVLQNEALREDISREAEEQANIRVLAFSASGLRYMMNNKHPILKPSDLKGLRMRVAKNPILLDTYKQLGGSPVGIAPTETYSALQTGVVDGHDGSPAWGWAMKFYEVQKYYSVTNHQLVTIPMIINNKFYESLPKDIQKAIRNAAFNSTWGFINSWHIDFIHNIIEKYKEKGVEIVYPDLKPFMKAVKPVWEKYADRVGGMKRIERALELQKDCF